MSSIRFRLLPNSLYILVNFCSSLWAAATALAIPKNSLEIYDKSVSDKSKSILKSISLTASVISRKAFISFSVLPIASIFLGINVTFLAASSEAISTPLIWFFRTSM